MQQAELNRQPHAAEDSPNTDGGAPMSRSPLRRAAATEADHASPGGWKVRSSRSVIIAPRDLSMILAPLAISAS